MRNFLKRLFSRSPEAEAAEALLAATVAQARDPWFHATLSVPDTLDGRFDSLTLHAVLVLEALGRHGPAGRAVAQPFVDMLFNSLDETVRELGVGDMGVPRRMKAMAGAFYGRAQAYRTALAESGDEALAEAVSRNLYRGMAVDAATLARVARYVRESVARLAETPAADLLAGKPRFADAA